MYEVIVSVAGATTDYDYDYRSLSTTTGGPRHTRPQAQAGHARYTGSLAGQLWAPAHRTRGTARYWTSL